MSLLQEDGGWTEEATACLDAVKLRYRLKEAFEELLSNGASVLEAQMFIIQEAATLGAEHRIMTARNKRKSES